MDISCLVSDDSQMRKQFKHLMLTDELLRMGRESLQILRPSKDVIKEDDDLDALAILDLEIAWAIHKILSGFPSHHMSEGKGKIGEVAKEGSSVSSWFSQNFSNKIAVRRKFLQQKSPKKISMRLQRSLALLWRSLSILRFVGMPGAQSAFFAHFSGKLREFPALSLSTGWVRSGRQKSSGILEESYVKDYSEWDEDEDEDEDEDKDGNGDEDEVSADGGRYDGGQEVLQMNEDKDDNFSELLNLAESASAEERTGRLQGKSRKSVLSKVHNDILQLPELSYLAKNNDVAGDPSIIDTVHDPLGIVQKLLDAAESCALSLSPIERGPLLSACLTLAVKSGRLSLLSQVITVLFLEQGRTLCDIDMALLDDVREHISGKAISNNSRKYDNSIKSMLSSLCRRPKKGGSY